MSTERPSSIPAPDMQAEKTDFTPAPPHAWINPAERREIRPVDEGNRRLFDKTARLVHRYSVDPMAKDAQGAYLMPTEEVESHLTQELMELRHADPLIALNLLLREKTMNPESRSMYVGVYRLVSPTLKQMNDTYLGPNETDNFVEDLNRAIHGLLGENKAHILKSTYKGSIFALDLDELPLNGDGTPMKAFKARVQEIQEMATRMLEDHLNRRLPLVQKKYASICRQLADFTQNEPTPYSEEAMKELARLQQSQKTTYETVQTIETRLNEIQIGDASVDIAFGLDRLGKEPKERMISLWNAECAANMAAIHMNGKKNSHSSLQLFHYRDLIEGSILAIQSLASILEDFGPDDPRTGQIRPEWEEFFSIHPETGYIQMRPDMINLYRHIDTYRGSQKYRDMGAQERKDFEDKIGVFGQYYKKMNVVDVLKPFVYENMGAYLDRIRDITNLVASTRHGMQSAEKNDDYLRRQLNETSTQLERSLKDARDNVTHTTRAAIRSLCEDGEKIMVFTDNIGFGALNQGSYERAIQSLVDRLGITENDWKAIHEGNKKLTKVIDEKIEQLAGTEEFEQSLLSMGDTGTRYLRDHEQKLAGLFGGRAIVNADGGDETIVYYTEKNGCELPEDLEAMERRLLQISVDLRMRLAAVIGPIRFSAITGKQGTPFISPLNRTELKTYIQKVIQYAEDSHAAIKALNERGEHEVRIATLQGLSETLAIN